MLEDFKLLVVDDFYDDADDVAQFAHRQAFRKTNLTGTQSLVTYAVPPQFESELAAISSLVGVDPEVALVKSKAWFWGFAGCGEFQLRLAELGTGKKHVHITGGWTGIVYLSRAHPEGHVGTYFYEHLETGVCHVAQTDPQLRERLDQDQGDSSWRVFAAPKIRYNRLVLFDSRYYHSESAGFGDSPASGRLVQIFNMGMRSGT